LYRQLSKQIQLAYEHMKKCSTFLVKKEMKIKTTLRFHFTPVRMTINKETNKKYWEESEGKGTLIHCWWECKLVQPLWTSVWRFFKNLKIELPYDPAIPLLGTFQRNVSQPTLETPTHHVYSTSSHNSQGIESAQVSTN
jgi:hypothetical protein